MKLSWIALGQRDGGWGMERHGPREMKYCLFDSMYCSENCLLTGLCAWFTFSLHLAVLFDSGHRPFRHREKRETRANQNANYKRKRATGPFKKKVIMMGGR